MLRVVSRLVQPSRRATQLTSKSLTGSVFTHGFQCRCGSCSSRYFSVQSQSHYGIPKTQTAIIRAHLGRCRAPVGKKMPLVGGHEGTGYVAAIAKNTRTSLKIGDPVGVKWLANSCLGCEDCRKGHETTCESVIMHGYTVDGSFQQWCVSYADHVTPIPNGYDMAAAAPLLCAGVTVYSALKEINGVPG
ncbi:putative alcohol dehydrogenase, partial [Phytophthora cinnamomi]|uniref:putative alcohol dehydrogenase n=1 Tax=Phytophthora cinnamomi TaxID=4785 RepID=UPI00355A3D2B